jgi:hypothetical protein
MKITHTRLTPSGPLPVFITSNKVLKTSAIKEHLLHKSYTCGRQIDWSFMLITDLLDQHPHTLLVSKDQQPIVCALIQLKNFFHSNLFLDQLSILCQVVVALPESPFFTG